MLNALRYSPRDPSTDLELMGRIVARDESALAEFYDRHGRLVYSLILRILRNRPEAEDMAQEAFLRVWTKSPTYDGALGSPAAWLARIARNCAIDRLRMNRARQPSPDAAPVVIVLQSAHPRAATAERSLGLTRALEALPRKQRELIEQAYYFGWTHTELADRLGLPLGTVKGRIRNGLLALRERLGTTAMATP